MEFQSIGEQLKKEKSKKQKKKHRKIGLIVLWFVLAFAMYGVFNYIADKFDNYVEEKKMDMGISQEEFAANFNKIVDENNSHYTLTKRNGDGNKQLYCFEEKDCLMMKMNRNGNLNVIFYDAGEVKEEDAYNKTVEKMTYIMKAADPTMNLSIANKVITSEGITYQMVKEKQDKTIVRVVNHQYFVTSKDSFMINIQNKH